MFARFNRFLIVEISKALQMQIRRDNEKTKTKKKIVGVIVKSDNALNDSFSGNGRYRI